MPPTQVELGLIDWILFAVLGGAVGLDGTSWPQVMISRPLVAGTVGGALLGSAADGFLAGAVLEIMALPYLPVGAARTPDVGLAGLLAGGAHAAAGQGAAGLAGAVLGGLIAGWVGGWSTRWLRVLNGRLVNPPEEVGAHPDLVESRHRWGLRLDFIRGLAVTGGLLVPAVIGAGVLHGGEGAAVAGLGIAAAVAASAGSGTHQVARGRWRPAYLAGGAGLAALALLAV